MDDPTCGFQKCQKPLKGDGDTHLLPKVALSPDILLGPSDSKASHCWILGVCPIKPNRALSRRVTTLVTRVEELTGGWSESCPDFPSMKIDLVGKIIEP